MSGWCNTVTKILQISILKFRHPLLRVPMYARGPISVTHMSRNSARVVVTLPHNFLHLMKNVIFLFGPLYACVHAKPEDVLNFFSFCKV